MEEREDEFEVLESIYGSGDDNYKSISKSAFQYKFGNDGDISSFLLEIIWPQNYPNEIPEFNLDSFFNKHLSINQKEIIIETIVKESTNHLGEVQTFTMIEWIKDHYEEISNAVKNVTSQTNNVFSNEDKHVTKEYEGSSQNADTKILGTKTTKKEISHLTKSQKRKEWDRMDGKGERSRGHDWVDVIKHLSQTGSQSN